MTVDRTPAPGRSISIREHWTAETEHELREEFASVERCYPSQGYGTMLTQVKQDPTGLLWHAEFSRWTSCD